MDIEATTTKPGLQKVDMVALSLTLALEGILLVTYRQEASNSNIKYLLGGNGDSMHYLTVNNISEVICTRLFEGKEYGGAVGYLSGCFKRLAIKEQSCDDKIRPDLLNCRKQIITFLASSLVEKDLFGVNSEDSINDLYLLLSNDVGGSTVMMKELVDELTEQDALDKVVTELVIKVYDNLNLKSSNMGFVSMLDVQEPAISVIQTLCKADKRYPRQISLIIDCFQLNPKFLSTHIPQQFQNMASHMIHPNLIEKFGTAGAAIENNTLLGRILRIAPALQDPNIMNLLGKSHKQSRVAVDGNINNLRSKINLATSSASELILSTLKVGGDSKTAAMTWLTQSVSLNAEAEKDHPSLFTSSSSGFLLNLNATFLILCQPIINDIEKLKKIQVIYMTKAESKAIFSAESTRLTPISAFNHTNGSSNGSSSSAHVPMDVVPSSSSSSPSSSSSAVVGTATTTAITKEESPMSFMTQSFFMCWRALHLGYAQQCVQYYNNLRGLSHFHEGLATDEPRSIHYFVRKLCLDVQLFNPLVLTDIVKFCACVSYVLLNVLHPVIITTAVTVDTTVPIKSVFGFGSNLTAQPPQQQPSSSSLSSAAATLSTSSWLVLPDQLSPHQRDILLSLPEHLIDDIMTILTTIARTEPSYLSTVTVVNSLEPVLSLILFFLRRPWAVQSPHLRAKFGQVLFHVFLPASLRKNEDMWSHHTATDGPHTNLLEHLKEAQEYLAPTLLLLYGDVEKTGFYEKLTNRRSIMIVLKHLWSLPSHRAAFRGIASMSNTNNNNNNANVILSATATSTDTINVDMSSADTILDEFASSSSMNIEDRNHNYFIRFANGLMNETNALVTTTMEKLSEIKKIQMTMKNPAEWVALGNEGQEQMKERLDQHEREVKGTAGLCIETLNMLNYLTSDEVIRLPFLMDEILPRFTSMLLSVLNKIIGSKGLEIKVDNINSYNFDPKTVLVEVCQAMLHFAAFPAFYETMAKDGFYENGATLKKTIHTIEKLQSMTATDIETMKALYENAQKAKEATQDFDSLTADAPDEFLDALLFTFMRDPVKLPTSGNIVDKSTIAQHLLNDETDPFNRQPLTLNAIIPLPELKQKIEDWVKSKTGGK